MQESYTFASVGILNISIALEINKKIYIYIFLFVLCLDTNKPFSLLPFFFCLSRMRVFSSDSKEARMRLARLSSFESDQRRHLAELSKYLPV